MSPRKFLLRYWAYKESLHLCKTLDLCSVLSEDHTWQLANFHPVKDLRILSRVSLWLPLLGLSVAMLHSSDVHAGLVINGAIPQNKMIDFTIEAITPKGNHKAPEDKIFAIKQNFPILNLDDAGDFGISKVLMDYKDVHGTSVEHGYIIKDFGRFFSLQPTVKLKPACIANFETCTFPIALTIARWKEEFATASDRGKELQLSKLSSVKNNNFSQSIAEDKFKYSFSTGNIAQSELAFFLAFEVFQPLTTSVPLLRANIGLGPDLPSKYFAFDYTYGGKTCTIGPLLSTCDQAFVDDIKLGLEDPLMWTYDGLTQSFFLDSDLVLPNILARLLDDDFNGSIFGFNENQSSSQSPEPEVPGPLPILGFFAALGYSHKLRKRIKDSKLEVSAI
jgi:hypothetical protein